MEGKINRQRIKDWSPKKQCEYISGLYKEVGQEAGHKRSFHSSDDKNRRNKISTNVMQKLHKEGLVNHVKPFFKEAIKLKGM